MDGGANPDGNDSQPLLGGTGSDGPIRAAEHFDPETGEWTEMATGQRARTYHNTDLLMDDGRVMVVIRASRFTHLPTQCATTARRFNVRQAT